MITDKNYSDLKISKVLLVLTLLIFTITACQDRTTDMQEVPSDAKITEAVRAQYNTSEAVPADNINIETTEGVVTLSGSTDNLLAKRKATELAQSIHGVLSVVNNVSVAASRPDDNLETDVNLALATHPATEALDISVAVQNGLVKLTGITESWQEKRLAEKIAAGVKGVKDINNTIMVQPNPIRPDKQIKQEVEQTLMMNSNIRNAKINVEVDSNRVILSGAVGSAYEKQLATDYSHVVGVDSVVADDLEVHPEYRSKMLKSDRLDVLTNQQIKNAIQRAFTYDPRVPEDRVEVTIREDVAILSGTVNNLNNKLAAESDARHTAGIQSVENNIIVEKRLVVETDVSVSDDAIQKRATLSIQRDPYVENAYISVSVRDGAVLLEGKVNSEFKKGQIEKVVSNVKGVTSIENRIKVVEDMNT